MKTVPLVEEVMPWPSAMPGFSLSSQDHSRTNPPRSSLPSPPEPHSRSW